jgi:hypothetical protein
MAFDFRKLRSAYSGDAIRVLRTSDNTEQDFGFVANEVVGSDVLNFVGWNLWSYSEELQQSVWTKTNLTVTTNTIVAPDGLTTADALLETAISGSFTFSRTGAVVSGSNYNYSFWLRPINGREFVRIVFGTQLNSATAWINMSTGTIASQTGFNSMTITAVSGGWYFVNMNITATATGTPNMSVNTSVNGSSISYTGDVTKGISIWGLQRTESLSALVYQKTEANPRGFGSISLGYDQTTGGDNVINATIIRQPIIVNNGNLITDNGKLALQGGSTLGLRSTGTIALSGYSDLFFTFGVNINNVTTGQILLESSTSFGGNTGAIQISINSGLISVLQRAVGVTTSKTYPISVGRQLITVRFRSGQTAINASQVWINGVEITGTVTLNNNSIALSNQVVYLFARAGNTIGFLGKYQNFTMFTDLAQRAGIENNINDYYGYY